ncbi:MAG: hypothetical protein ACI87E_005078 [Mariniblastus sp.]|jgi:hypothetical protein
MNIPRISVLLSAALVALQVGIVVGHTTHQTTSPTAALHDDQEQTSLPPGGVTFSEPIETQWEFGVSIKAGANTLGIASTMPIPMNWPEQEIEILAEEKSDNIAKLSYKNPTDHSKQALFKIPRMAAGQTETVTVRFRVKKRLIVAPIDTSQFKFATSLSKDLKSFLKPSPFIECKDKRIREIADSLKDVSLSAWDQTEKILRWVRENVEYEFGTRNFSCLEALEAKRGDCGELSSLFIAICRAQGIPARAVWIPDHMYPEFYLVDQAGRGHWFPCQAAGQYEFGSMTELKPILHKGDRFKIPGERKEVRFLRATLVARSGGASLGWFSRMVVGPPANKTVVGTAPTRPGQK